MKDPRERMNTNRTGNFVDDTIIGILIGYKDILQRRNQWVDVITIKEASNEIKALIETEKEKAIAKVNEKINQDYILTDDLINALEPIINDPNYCQILVENNQDMIEIIKKMAKDIKSYQEMFQKIIDGIHGKKGKENETSK